MRTPILKVLIAFSLLGSTSVDAQQPGQSFTVHGRLNSANGNARCVIWIVGTNRRLAVRQSADEVPDMPDTLWRMLLSHENTPRDLYADFSIEPITPYKKGARQWVRVVSASNLVVVENGKIILLKHAL